MGRRVQTSSKLLSELYPFQIFSTISIKRVKVFMYLGGPYHIVTFPLIFRANHSNVGALQINFSEEFKKTHMEALLRESFLNKVVGL